MFSDKIKQLASAFANAIVEAVEGEMREKMTTALSSLGGNDVADENDAPRPRAAKKSKASRSEGRLPRRSLEEIQAVVGHVAKLLSKHKDGLRSEEIRKALDLDVREVPRVLKEGIANGTLKVLSGQKRSTCYGVGSGRKSAKKASRKAGKVKAAPKTKSKKASKKVSSKKKAKKISKASKTANGVVGHATAASAEATA